MTVKGDGITVRAITDEEFAEWAAMTEQPFFEELTEGRLARWRRVAEAQRSLVALDGDRMVGGSSLFRMTVTVPGGEVAMGGLTAVGVLPTHRRRGVLTALMKQHFEDMREWGEPLSGLYAAEAPIYRRYGYGSAAPQMMWTLDRRDTAFHPDLALSGGVRLVQPDEALRTFPAVYDAVRTQRPGMPDRNPAVWQNWVGEDPPDRRGGLSQMYLAQLEDRGYVLYRGKVDDWPHGLARGTLSVLEHMATDAVAAATLWRYVFDHDLIAEFKITQRPTDDLLPLFLVNPRGLTGWQNDGMWLRLMDVGTALQSRTYAVDDAVTIGVVDARVPDNSGSWRLEGGPAGAECTPTDAEPHVRVDAADLGGAYLGNLKLSRLVRAGLAEQSSPGAAARADRMFATDPAPWSPQEF